MSYVDLSAHLDTIAGHDGKEREAVDIRLALDRYPDLVGYRHTTNQLLLCSADCNVFCDDVDIQRQGNVYVAVPFLVDMCVRLHANPVIFYIGVDNEAGFGVIPYQDWELHLEKAQIDRKIIRKIRNFLDSHRPASYL